ncbi:MAG: hypothetical protein EXR32_08380 [Betaproteobacteria bacterium]|nr:hypothetical protein [Betaproteobacteria bacterium]
MKIYRFALTASLLLCALSAARAQAPAEGKPCAMIVMHGKWGSPRFLEGFARTMAPTCDAKSIEMPWSGRRSYDVGYPAALQEISAQPGTEKAGQIKSRRDAETVDELAGLVKGA